MGFTILPASNRIPMDEWLLRCEEFFKVQTEFAVITPERTTEMFNLHNDKLLPRETGKSCSGCRSRVYNRLKAYYNEVKNSIKTDDKGTVD